MDSFNWKSIKNEWFYSKMIVNCQILTPSFNQNSISTLESELSFNRRLNLDVRICIVATIWCQTPNPVSLLYTPSKNATLIRQTASQIYKQTFPFRYWEVSLAWAVGLSAQKWTFIYDFTQVATFVTLCFNWK